MKRKKRKINRKNSLKKLFFSSLAIFSLAITGIISGISTTKTNLISNNLTTNRDVASSNTFTPPSTNDLYDDYAYVDGFVTITNNSVINFSDWFGFHIWKFDVDANAGKLFGSSNLKVASLKVRSSLDKTQIFVYGYLSNDSSFLFRLDVENGTIVPIGDVDSFSGNTLIEDANLLTIADGFAILTQKTPVVVGGSSQTYKVYTSEINLSSGSLTNNSYDITGAKAAWYVVSFGEIIDVQKIDSTYIFIVKAITYDSSDNSQYRPSALMIKVQNGAYTTGSVYSFWSFTDSSSSFDLDNSFTILNVDQGTSQTAYISGAYSTASTTFGINQPSGTVVSVNLSDSNASDSNIAPYIGEITINSVTGSDSNDSVAGITNFLYDSSNNIPYAVVADGGSNSKIAIANLNSSTAPGWIDLSSIGVETSDYQTINLNFVPNTSDMQETSPNGIVSSGYSGYIDVKQYSDPNSTTYNESKSLFLLDSTGTILSQITDVNYSLGMTDTAIFDKYKPGKVKATESTKLEVVNDLTKVEQNGEPINVVYTDNVNLDVKDQTIEGDVILTLNNWWNTGTSQLTRYVDINLSMPNVAFYASIALAIIVVIAFILMIIKATQNKKIQSYFDENIV